MSSFQMVKMLVGALIVCALGYVLAGSVLAIVLPIVVVLIWTMRYRAAS